MERVFLAPQTLVPSSGLRMYNVLRVEKPDWGGRGVGVEQCNHCYFWRKACHKKACYTSHLTERTGWFSICVVPSLSPSFAFVLSWIYCQGQSWMWSRYIYFLNLQHCETSVCREMVCLNCRHLPLLSFFSSHWNIKAWLLEMAHILCSWVVQSIAFLTGDKILIFKCHFPILPCWKRGIVGNSCS